MGDWLSQLGTEDGTCARFCRALCPGQSISHFHSKLATWDGRKVWESPFTFVPELSCITLPVLPVPLLAALPMSDDDSDDLEIVDPEPCDPPGVSA